MAVLDTVCGEEDRRKDEVDDLKASWHLLAATPQDRP